MASRCAWRYDRRVTLRSALVVLALIAGLAACSPADHAPDTKELVTVFRVDHPEGGGRTHYEATFSRGGAFLPIPLDEGDQISVAPAGGTAGVLVSDKNPIGITYTLDREDPPFPSVTFTLSRFRGGTAASSTSFAPAISDFTPAEGTTMSYGDGSAPLTMRWSNKVDGALVTFATHACDQADARVPSKPDADEGKLALALKDVVVDGPPKVATCVRLELARSIPGKLDPIITAPGSSITGWLVHRVTITITP